VRIVCGTNVLVSGVLFGGPPRRILTLLAQGVHASFTSPALLREAEEVFLRPKFGLTPAQVSSMIELLLETFELVHPRRRVRGVRRDPDDNIVLEAAAAGVAERIVSGDRHLLEMKRWRRVVIVSPAQLLEEQGM